MSAKNMDHQNRWRNRAVSFRVSEEENEEINLFVKLCGTSKQQYITDRLLCKDVVVVGNTRVYKALRNEFREVLQELKRLEAGDPVNEKLLNTIDLMAAIMKGMKEEETL